ncbi:MAG TPA: dihydrodipicolinate reductase [Rhodobacteraceae bacterium]|jgi:hypothetical protein|nr:dihydrodipicolinate reductase [Paracoccaceae bacterium]
MRSIVIALALAALAAVPARAEFDRITEESAFRDTVAGKTLKRTLISLQVRPDGAITGTGGMWDVTGRCNWREGYFCREMSWRDRSFGMNCQEVRVSGDRIRFTADRGQGDSAEFRLTR